MPPEQTDPTVIEFDVRTDEMLVNMGPQHPSTHGVLRLVLRTDGEVISEVTPHLGYLHRCAEKIGENVTPIQFIPYTDRMDYLAGWTARTRKFLDYFKPRIPEYHALLTENHIFVKRTAGVGVLTKEMALGYACTGPMLRASLDRTKGDPDWDLRKTEPYCGYEQYQFDVPLPPYPEAPPDAVIGDCWHRFYIRMREVVESLKIIEQAIERYPTAQGSHR